MATQAIYQVRRGELHQLVRGWDRRLRLQQVFTWLPRALLPGLTIGIAIAVVSRLRPWLQSGQVLLATGILLALGFVAMLAAVWLWPRPSLTAARRFDRLFGLQERVSTALELIDGRIHADDALVALQVDDAWQKARGVRASESLPLTWRWREWSGIILVALVLALLLIIPNPQEEKIAQDSAQRAAIDSAADQLRQITQDVAADAALEPEKRDQLLQALQTSTNVLQQPNVTPEEAFASLSDAQSALQEKADDLNQQANSGQAGLQAASDSLRNFQSSDQQQQQSQDGAQGVQSALNNLSQNAAGMNQQQQQDAASSLQQASQAMQQSNPDAAQAMQQASQSLQNGDPSSAQQSLGQASDSIQQTQQQQQNQQSSAQQLSQSAQSVQESANQVSQQSQQNQQNQNGQDGQNGQQGDQSQNNQQQGQQGNQGQQNPQNGQPQSNQQNQQGQNGQQPNQQGQQGDQGQQGQPQDGQQQGQQGDQGQQGQSGQPQDGQQGQSGSQPGDQGQQPGQAGQGGQSNQQGQPGQNGQPASGNGSQQDGSQNGSAAGAGAGDGAGDAGQDGQQSGGSQTGQMPQTNNPDGQGQGQYDPVYAPQRIGGQSAADQQVQLNGDASQSPVQEGDFSQNPDGNVNVPYDQVFSDYSNAANRALQSDYIPLGLRDVVRDYFSSLEPGQNSQASSSQP
ncbi:MAG: hypothetical protein ABI690_19955 [Chloroflexota bacterium]